MHLCETSFLIVCGFSLAFSGVQTQSISDSLNSFALDLLSATATEAPNSENLALSPYTVWSLLSIIDEGAFDNTAKELDAVLRLPTDKSQFRNQFANLSDLLLRKEPGVELDISNGIFTTTDQKLKTQFQDISRKFYKVNVQPINFKNAQQAIQTINKYVSAATKNRITDFLHAGDVDDAQIFITSVLYFKGAWTFPFNRTATKRHAFYDEKQNKIGEVDMMFQATSFPYTRIETLRCHALELPYGPTGERMSMVVLLPFAGETVANLMKSLTKHPFVKVVLDPLAEAKAIYDDEDVQVYLPRFSVKSDLYLNVVLDKMGIRDLFNDRTANLLGIFPHYLYVSKLVQRAEIDVNEEGTVAAAAAGAQISYKQPPPQFMANKPFVYLIVDKVTNSIVFSGKVSSPP